MSEQTKQKKQSKQANVSEGTDRPRPPFFATAVGIIVAAALLWLACILTAALATISITDPRVTGLSENNRLFVDYLAYIPSALFGLFGMTLVIIGSVRWAVYGRNSLGSSAGSDVDTELLESINSRMVLSDTAKRIAYRNEDVQLLHTTIREDIRKGDYDAALALVGELDQTYGQKEEAEGFRDQIADQRDTKIKAEVSEALTRLKEILDRHDFDKATVEAGKIQRLYPESPAAQDAVKQVVQSRERYKHDLEREFLEAAKREDANEAMRLLKEMDKYLTEQEAEPFRETARGVIGQARDNLGVQFKMAVQDKEWLTAVRVGEQILQEFPNSRMADEVRSMLDLLRERAAGQQAAGGQSQGQTQPRTNEEPAAAPA